MLRKIALIIAYYGAPFFGWQSQPVKPTIQTLIQNHLKEVSKEDIKLIGASRTDKGVHALQQVAHFETHSYIDPKKWAPILNKRLPKEVRVKASIEMPLEFHAQKSVLSKTYRYSVLNRQVANPLAFDSYFTKTHFDWEMIQKGMHLFIGTKDFKAFQNNASQSEVLTTIRTIYTFELLKYDGGVYHFIIEGSGFLKQMVRNIVGTLLELGEGKQTIDSISQLFLLTDRRLAGRTLRAEGLTLVKVSYPKPLNTLLSSREDCV